MQLIEGVTLVASACAEGQRQQYLQQMLDIVTQPMQQILTVGGCGEVVGGWVGGRGEVVGGWVGVVRLCVGACGWVSGWACLWVWWRGWVGGRVQAGPSAGRAAEGGIPSEGALQDGVQWGSRGPSCTQAQACSL